MKQLMDILNDCTLDSMFEKVIEVHNNLVNNGYSIAVLSVTTNQAGVICENSGKMHCYKSYINAIDYINSLEYESNTGVEVYSFDNTHYALIMSKPFDGVCYSRFAHVQKHKLHAGMMLHLYNIGVRVFIDEN